MNTTTTNRYVLRIPCVFARTRMLLLLVLASAVYSSMLPALQAQGIDAKKVREATLNGVVLITPHQRGENGSGFIIHRTASNVGYVFTNVHVIEHRDSVGSISVRFADNVTMPCDSIVYEDAARDIAVLKVSLPSAQYQALPMIKSGNVGAGDAVVAFGNPNNVPFNITQGIISNLFPLSQFPFYLAFDAATNPGNSGGPLLNRFGQVVGMVAARVERDTRGRMMQNFNLAIKAAALRDALETLGITFRDTILVPDETLIREKFILSRQDSIAQQQQTKFDSLAEAQRLAEYRQWERSTPTRLVARLGGGIAPHLGSMIKTTADEYDWVDAKAQFTDFWQVNGMFGLRTGVFKPGDRGTIIATFLALGTMPSLRSLRGDPVYFEAELGFLFGEYLRLSAGLGIQDVGYISGTLGYTLNLFDFFTLDATLTGCFAETTIIYRAQLAGAIRFDFAKW